MYTKSDHCLRCRRLNNDNVNDYCDNCQEIMETLWRHEADRTIDELELICMKGNCEICSK